MKTFAMQNNMWAKMWMMKMQCCKDHKKKKSCCFLSKVNIKIVFSNTTFSSKIIKIKLFSFVDIFLNSNKFLENKNLIKNTSPPPNLNKKIKYYSYSDLVKIIKSNT